MRVWPALLVAVAVLAGCSSIPLDPDGTLAQVRGGTLRVGVSPAPPWTVLPQRPGGDPTGVEVDLVTGFAESLDADVEWVVGGEQRLVDDLARGELELVVGGLTADSPWVSSAALTRPYVSVPGPTGQPEPHVVAAPMGENAFLVQLERYLLAQEVAP